MSIDHAAVAVQSFPEPRPAELDTWEPTAIDRAWWAEHSHAPEPYDEALELADIFDEDLDLAAEYQDWLEERRLMAIGLRMVGLDTGLTDADVAPYGVD